MAGSGAVVATAFRPSFGAACRRQNLVHRPAVGCELVEVRLLDEQLAGDWVPWFLDLDDNDVGGLFEVLDLVNERIKRDRAVDPRILTDYERCESRVFCLHTCQVAYATADVSQFGSPFPTKYQSDLLRYFSYNKVGLIIELMTILEYVTTSARASGVPVKLTDTSVLHEVAAMLG